MIHRQFLGISAETVQRQVVAVVPNDLVAVSEWCGVWRGVDYDRDLRLLDCEQ